MPAEAALFGQNLYQLRLIHTKIWLFPHPMFSFVLAAFALQHRDAKQSHLLISAARLLTAAPATAARADAVHQHFLLVIELKTIYLAQSIARSNGQQPHNRVAFQFAYHEKRASVMLALTPSNALALQRYYLLLASSVHTVHRYAR